MLFVGAPRRLGDARRRAREGSVFEPRKLRLDARLLYSQRVQFAAQRLRLSAARAAERRASSAAASARAARRARCLGAAERRETRERLVELGGERAVLAAERVQRRRRLLRRRRRERRRAAGRRAWARRLELAQPGLERRLLDRERLALSARLAAPAARDSARRVCACFAANAPSRSAVRAARSARAAASASSGVARRGVPSAFASAASSRAARVSAASSRAAASGASALLGRASSRAGLVDGLEGSRLSRPSRVLSGENRFVRECRVFASPSLGWMSPSRLTFLAALETVARAGLSLSPGGRHGVPTEPRRSPRFSRRRFSPPSRSVAL